jgi:GH43 family beta-xylosidase
MRTLAPVLLAAACESTHPIIVPDAAADAAVVAPPSVSPATFRNWLNGGPDPFVVYDAPYYYLATTQGDAVRIWRATSLDRLAVAAPTTVWQDGSQEVWAPAFYKLDGRWYLYYTSDDGTDANHRIHVVESDGDDPLGPYHDKAQLETSGWAIDPVILEQATGRYLVWSGAGTEGHNLLYIAPMSDPWTVSGARTYLPAAGGCPEVREAPSILQHDGRTFLVYSTCDTGKPDYQLWMMSIATADDPTNVAAWTQHDGAILARDDAAGVWGPGSSGFFKSPDGSEDWIVYHAKNTSEYTYDFRTTRAQPITWNAGLPVIGAPIPTSTTLHVPSGDDGHTAIVMDDNVVAFSADWTAYPGCGVQCYGGGDHGSDATGATATFYFGGSQIALYSARDAGNGIAAISIDHGPETMHDFYAPIRQGEEQLFVSDEMPLGPHILEIRVTGEHDSASAGAAISVDRAEILTD